MRRYEMHFSCFQFAIIEQPIIWLMGPCAVCACECVCVCVNFREKEKQISCAPTKCEIEGM